MLKVDAAFMQQAEKLYPGFRETLDYYEALDLPHCPRCGSSDTAAVSAGLVGRSMHLAAATTKIKLLPNGRPGSYYCNACSQFFDAPAK